MQVLKNSSNQILCNSLGKLLFIGTIEKLATPQNVSMSAETASWTEVENAETYEFYVDDTSIGSKLVYYHISATTSNVSASSSNPTFIAPSGTATLVFTADGINYKVPTTTPTVTGATSVYTRTSDTQCSITLSNPTGNVSFSIIGQSCTWEDPEQEGDNLTVTQAYSVTQSGSALTIQ